MNLPDSVFNGRRPLNRAGAHKYIYSLFLHFVRHVCDVKRHLIFFFFFFLVMTDAFEFQRGW